MHYHVTESYSTSVKFLVITRYTSHIYKCMVLENQGLKFYQHFNLFQSWRPQPPPPPLFDDDDDDDDDWLS